MHIWTGSLVVEIANKVYATRWDPLSELLPSLMKFFFGTCLILKGGFGLGKFKNSPR